MIKLCGLEDLKEYQQDTVMYCIIHNVGLVTDNLPKSPHRRTSLLIREVLQGAAWNATRYSDFVSSHDGLIQLRKYERPSWTRDNYGINERVKLFK